MNRPRHLSFATATVLVLALALVIRVIYWRFAIPDYQPVSDDAQYLEIATSIVDGDGFSLIFPQLHLHPTAFRPPLYPYLLAGLFVLVGGPSVAWAQALNLVIGLGVVFLTVRVGARIGGRRAGIVAGGLVAVFPPLVANDVVLLTEPLSLLLLLGCVLALLRERWLLAGLLAGGLVLVRPSAQFLVVAIVLWLWLSRRRPGGWRRTRRRQDDESSRHAASSDVAIPIQGVTNPASLRGRRLAALDIRQFNTSLLAPVLRPVLLVGAGAVLITAPWLARNRVVMGDATLVTSNGFNAAALYSPQATETGAFVDPVRDERFDDHRFAQFDEIAWQRELQDLAWQNVVANPTVVVRVASRNLAAYLEIRPDHNRNAEMLDGRNLTVRSWALPLFYANLVVGTYGLVRLRRTAAGQLLIVLAAYFVLTSVLLIAAPRVRAPVDLILCIATATVIARASIRRWPGRTRSAEGTTGSAVPDAPGPDEPVVAAT